MRQQKCKAGGDYLDDQAEGDYRIRHTRNIDRLATVLKTAAGLSDSSFTFLRAKEILSK